MTDQALPKNKDDFEWVQASWGAALRCRPLADIAPHYFSTCELGLEGVRDEDHEDTKARRHDDPEGWKVLARAMGVELDALVRMRQVHGADVFVAEKGIPFFAEADIAVSDNPSLALTVRTADCVPILLADRRGSAVAAVHAGWKGTAAGAAMVAVRALGSRFGTRPRDVVAAVGPSIGPCCYEVSHDLVKHFAAHPDRSNWFLMLDDGRSTIDDDRPHLDLWCATRDQLERAGVPAAHIHVAALCTFDYPLLFHSYRRDGTRAGRLVAAIRSAPGRTP